MSDNNMLHLPKIPDGEGHYEISRFDNERPRLPTLEVTFIGSSKKTSKEVLSKIERVRSELAVYAGFCAAVPPC